MSARTSLLRSLSWFVFALASAGCDDSLKSVSLIEETRVLGARVEVEQEPLRSSPHPGERASLRLLVAAPDGAANFSYALSLCAVRLTNNGFPSCDGAPFASAVEIAPSTKDARLDFQVPQEVDLETTPHAFASGLVCPDAGLQLGTDLVPRCLMGTGTEVAFEFALGGPEQSNQNPSFAPNGLALDGATWPASTEMSCEGDSLPRVPTKSRHVIGIDLADSDFELLPRSTSIDPARETLLASSFSSAGKLDHGFLALSAETPADQRRVSWDAPPSADGIETLVRFYFVVRDARGGQDFAERALCVVPP
jgi:hypothetical protein